MRVLVLHAHPVPESYGRALYATSVSALEAAGHEVDRCDLYAESFDPVLSPSERRCYHDENTNTRPVADYVARLRRAEALVIVSPVWNFGFPAMLKGFFDRVFLPGVSFRISNGRVVGSLHNIRRITAVMTYGGDRKRAFLVGDPPRKLVTRVLRAVAHPLARIEYLAHYDMNRSTDATRALFLQRVMRSLGRP